MQGQEEVQHPTALPVLPLALSREDVMVVIGFHFVKVVEGLPLVAVLKYTQLCVLFEFTDNKYKGGIIRFDPNKYTVVPGGLPHNRRSWDELLHDVCRESQSCATESTTATIMLDSMQPPQVRPGNLKCRQEFPSTFF